MFVARGSQKDERSHFGVRPERHVTAQFPWALRVTQTFLTTIVESEALGEITKGDG